MIKSPYNMEYRSYAYSFYRWSNIAVKFGDLLKVMQQISNDAKPVA